MSRLPPDFLRLPIAHRGLHGPGAPENSLAAARAAIEAGYGIELDIQPAADGTPMVFHDYDLVRLTGDKAAIAVHSPADLAEKRLLDSDEAIPTLTQFLELVAGRVPLLIEIKDQDGRLGSDIGELHRRVAEELDNYQGLVAVMSFNPHTVRAFHEMRPDIPVGITSCGYPAEDWPLLDHKTRSHLAAVADFDQSGSCFISHDKSDLANPRVDALKAQGIPILCWTVQSSSEENAARQFADNITFEDYQPSIVTEMQLGE
ncbi:glycerophosphodiester phosphodiesterase family protein [Paracoccus onubensis]|uniref:glycerophosphodiester phosphodiesterase family protein n=1 Tax=Paracoccus onubensis TaxID=1675788 RepID=UPI00273093F1|nr:glycerophosphodiester phosphodiesterase family protein [Paracoccus onubensis]MDP0926776.1 glycerophosphodiester phosphodiesterase family protein [Paracoccus onubensis]